MKRAPLVLPLILAGCTINLNGNGEIGVGHRGEYFLYHRTEMSDPSQSSEAKLDATRNAWQWIADDDDPDGGPDD